MTNIIKEFDRIVLTEDLPSLGLVSGDIGVVVMIHQEGEGFEVEFLALDGESIGVETLHKTQVRAIHSKEIPHVRNLMEAA
jgi:ATP-dependent exoDNAse (exonuclease V) alpha subunit